MQNANARTTTDAYKLCLSRIITETHVRRCHRVSKLLWQVTYRKTWMQPNFKNSVCFSHQARNCRTKMAALTKQVSLQLSVSLPKESKPHKNSKGHQKSCSLIIGGGKAQGCRGSTASSRSCIMPLSLVLLCQKKLPSNSRSTVPPPGWAYTAACTVMTVNGWVPQTRRSFTARLVFLAKLFLRWVV